MNELSFFQDNHFFILGLGYVELSAAVTIVDVEREKMIQMREQAVTRYQLKLLQHMRRQ